MRLIPLTQGKFAQVDDADFGYLNQFKWHARKGHQKRNSPTWYACRRVSDGIIGMHNVVKPDWKRVDHVDTDGLNNQRHNLREASLAQNMQNSRKGDGYSSRFKGVSWHKQRRKWHATISVSGKRKHLGLFATEEDAARAYDACASVAFGSFARLNFPA